MPLTRRDFLAASAALGAAALAHAAPLIMPATARLLPPSTGRRVVVVGGGWGGLAAARRLHELAPELEVVLLEKQPAFWSAPMSNKWLADLIDTRRLVHDYRAAADAYGYTFIQAEASDIDRDKRRVVTAQGTVDYDWLILAVGIRYDFEPWFGDDRRAIEHTRQNFPCAYVAGREALALKEKLRNFQGGDLVMTLPPMPYRCPPSPYERACLIGWLFKTRGIKGRLIVLDPNPMMQSFNKVFSGQYKDQIVYVPQAHVKAIDPFKQTLATDFDDYRFDDAILMAPQQAGELVWKAGLIGRDAAGKPTGWADQHPVHLHARDDERIFLVGDLIGKASPLFGHYPKSGHLASRLGDIAAHEIAARAQGLAPAPRLPESVCYTYASVEPMELIKLDAQYRFRGDGLIAQSVKQTYDPNPRGEDEQWAEAMFGDFLAARS